MKPNPNTQTQESIIVSIIITRYAIAFPDSFFPGPNVCISSW